MDNKLIAIAEEIIEYSDGSFHIAWSEEYDALSISEQRQVEDVVYDNIASCDGCGWNFSVDSLEQLHEGSFCWQCYDDVDEESE